MISGVIPQLRTTDLRSSIDFYTTKLGFQLEFQYEDFYAGDSQSGFEFDVSVPAAHRRTVR